MRRLLGLQSREARTRRETRGLGRRERRTTEGRRGPGPGTRRARRAAERAGAAPWVRRGATAEPPALGGGKDRAAGRRGGRGGGGGGWREGGTGARREGAWRLLFMAGRGLVAPGAVSELHRKQDLSHTGAHTHTRAHTGSPGGSGGCIPVAAPGKVTGRRRHSGSRPRMLPPRPGLTRPPGLFAFRGCVPDTRARTRMPCRRGPGAGAG